MARNKCWWGCGEKETLIHCWWECKLVQPLWKTVRRFLQKLKIELPYDIAIPLLGIYLKKTKTWIRKDICTPVFIAALFTMAKIWMQPKCPSIDEWLKKMWCIQYIQWNILIKEFQILLSTHVVICRLITCGLNLVVKLWILLKIKCNRSLNVNKSRGPDFLGVQILANKVTISGLI